LAFRKLSIALAATWLVALSFSPTAGAQDRGNLTIEIASIDSTAFPNISAVVNALDAKGRPLAGLDAASFSATIDGAPVTVNALQTVVDSQVSLSVVLVVDASGSMAGQPLTAAQAAAAGFVNGLSPQDSVAILAFSDAVTVAQEPTTDKATAIDALQKLTAAGDTALFEATSRAVAKTAALPSTRRVIILLSDGVDYGGKSTVTRDDSIAQARFAGVPIYAIALGSEVDKAYLNELAQATGARFLETPSPEGLSQLYADIAAVLRGQYIVALQSPDVDSALPHTLELSINVDGVTAIASKDVAVTSSAAQPPLTVDELDVGQEVKSASGGTSKVLLLAGLLVVMAVLTGLYISRPRTARVKRDAVEVRLRPWSNGSPLAGGLSLITDESPPVPIPEPAEEPGGKLVVIGGPSAGQEFLVGLKPISIGSADWCHVVVPHGEGCIGQEEARAWVHQDKLIFHKLMRLSLIANDEAAGAWVILEDGDEISIGDLRLRFVSMTHMTKDEVVVNEAVSEAVQRLAAHHSTEAAEQDTITHLWSVDDYDAEPAVDSGSEALPLQLIDAPASELPANPEDAGMQQTVTTLRTVDEAPLDQSGDEEDLDPPAAAASA